MKRTRSLRLTEDQLDFHPEVMKCYCEKNTEPFKLSLGLLGLLQPLKVVQRGDKYFVFDGISRLSVIRQLGGIFKGFPKVDCEVYEIEDDRIGDYHIFSNSTLKRSFTERCLMLDHLIKLIGPQPGKKRTISSLCKKLKLDEDDVLERVFKGTLPNDVVDIAAGLSGIHLSAPTIRKMLDIHRNSVFSEKVTRAIIKDLDNGETTIAFIHKKLKSEERKKKNKTNLKVVRNSRDGQPKSKIYHKSCEHMTELEDESVDIEATSIAYFDQRKYPNQPDECPLGEESTREEYLQRMKKIFIEMARVLKKGGVTIVNIGESYNGGYQGIATRIELLLEEVGLQILDVEIWVKKNQQYTHHENRCRNSYERIIIAFKPGGKIVFNPITDQNYQESEKKESKKNSKGMKRFYLSSEYKEPTNVFFHPVCNPSELKLIDPDYRHSAPSPMALFEKYLTAYGLPGMTCLDIMCGSGTTLEVALRLGMNVVGYDVDIDSVECARKRCEMTLSGELIREKGPQFRLIEGLKNAA